jgi:hypothetical protein
MWAMAVLTQPAVTQRMPVERRPPGAVVYPGDTADRAAWRLALEATKPAWSRAYRDEPSRGDEALRVLADALLDEIESPAYVGVAA